jgi:hypothetical protein
MSGYNEDVSVQHVLNEQTGEMEHHSFMRVDGKVTDVGGAVVDYQPPDKRPSLDREAFEKAWVMASETHVPTSYKRR